MGAGSAKQANAENRFAKRVLREAYTYVCPPSDVAASRAARAAQTKCVARHRHRAPLSEASSAASRASAKASKRRSSSVIRGASGCSANESLSSTRCRLASCANVDLAASKYSRYQKTCSRSEGVTTNSRETSNANVRSINNRLYLRAQVPRYRACSLGSRSARGAPRVGAPRIFHELRPI